MSKSENKPVTAVLVGAGTRGRDAYGAYALKYPSRLKFIAICDSDDEKRKIFQELHNIPDDYAFPTWNALFNAKIGKIAQVAFICTPDRMHHEPAIEALELDYDLFLEKPIAPTLEECQDIAKCASAKNRIVQVGHVLRFTNYWQALKEFLATEKLGKIVHYDHSENVSYWHFGHSFVRGPYKNKEESTAIVLAKTCHDLDLIYWLMGEKPVDVYSHGELTHYKPENAPPKAPERCTDGCPIEDECPWYAPRLYLELEPVIRTGKYSPSRFVRWIIKRILKSKSFLNFVAIFSKDIKRIKNWDQFPVTHLTNDYSIEGRMKALKEGPYGLCIYKTGSDVPDHQVSTFNFPSGASVTLVMHGLSEHEGREFRIFGTKGVIRGVFRNSLELIEFIDFRNGDTETIYKKGLTISAHGGGDEGIMHAFTTVMLGERSREEGNLTDVLNAMESHFMGFAAEESRLTGKKQPLENYR
ncbi:MAG: Gfo/Idh/MocA family oxidoreductase [Candidatus Heimdallarchaeota archaeon]|nr:Gfo/Idh/MocA family oxidoreductase [Candidatus Heimdallarchaeota archaeon]MBY8995039.1 Gfo/Idh/MocA family oxidoreductase [Candidatus Heimdallarchaeota archaeon]